MISIKLTEARLRKWGILEFTSLQTAVVLSLEGPEGMVKTTFKHPRKQFNLFYIMASDLYLNIWSRWKTELQRVRVNQCQFSVIFIPNRTFLVRFGGISGEFGRAMVRILARRTHGETKRAWYAAEAYQKGAIRYLPYPNSS